MRIPCPQCGGEVTVQEAEGFPACPFCGASFVQDLTGIRLHFLYRPRIGAADVLPVIRRRADRHGQVIPPGPVSPRLVYYPFWRYTGEGAGRLLPAWPTLEEAWAGVRLPDGEQIFFDPALVQGADVIEPAVPEAAVRERFLGATTAQAGDLVRLPVFEAQVRLDGHVSTVSVEACSGSIVCASGSGAESTRGGRREWAGWILGGGLAMLGAAIAIRPWGIATLAVGVLAILLYGVLEKRGRGRAA